MEGWISLYRKVRNHWLWKDPVKFQWWIDLLMLANYKENKIQLNNEIITVDIGEHITSIEKLAERWDIDRKTVTKFLSLLESDNMITLTKSRKNGTSIKVNNYKAYQYKLDDAKDNGVDNRMDIAMDNMMDNNMDINKKEKELLMNYEKESVPTCEYKKTFGEFMKVHLTESEYQLLISSYGFEKADYYIGHIDRIMFQTNNEYNDKHYAKIKDWIEADIEKAKATQQQPQQYSQSKPNRFVNFPQRKWDYNQIMQLEREALQENFAK